jgi:diaminopimelate decarboxylase
LGPRSPNSPRSSSRSKKSAGLVEELKRRGLDVKYFNIGGGLGIRYKDEEVPTPKELVDAVRPALEATGAKILCEMGRYIAGNAGVLLTRVLYRKRTGEKSFLVADAGMNDLLRPALYDAYHDVRPLREDGTVAPADLVGPVCESGDRLARDRELPTPPRATSWRSWVPGPTASPWPPTTTPAAAPPKFSSAATGGP